MSGLSEDGKADRVVDKNGMVNPKWVQRVFIEVEVPRNHVECDGDDMAVHNVGGPERRANAPLAQLVRASLIINIFLWKKKYPIITEAKGSLRFMYP